MANIIFVSIFFSLDTGSQHVFYIFADNVMVNSTSNNFQEALLQTFVLFFNFNIQYPRESSQTLDFIQRYFFNYQTDISRGTKRNINAQAKVLRLINNLWENST